MVKELYTDSGPPRRPSFSWMPAGIGQKLGMLTDIRSTVDSEAESGFVAGGAREDRFWYIDNIRLFVIVCVVMHHLAVTYSGFGSWYYVANTNLGILSTI